MLVCLIFKNLMLERAVGMSEVCVELVGRLVEEMLGLSKEELSPSDNLISLGLGSLDIMRIAGLLTKNGCNVTFFRIGFESLYGFLDKFCKREVCEKLV